MNDELDPLGLRDADLEKASGGVGVIGSVLHPPEGACDGHDQRREGDSNPRGREARAAYPCFPIVFPIE